MAYLNNTFGTILRLFLKEIVYAIYVPRNVWL